MILHFTSLQGQPPGLVVTLLTQSYSELLRFDLQRWKPVVSEWEKFDREVFAHPDTIGACVFLSWADQQIVGFGSYDPRQKPETGIVGHNCILPEYRGRGLGTQQLREILRRFQTLNIRRAKVTTGAHPFFLPARRMYAAGGFHETGRRPWAIDPAQEVIDFELDLPVPAKKV